MAARNQCSNHTLGTQIFLIYNVLMLIYITNQAMSIARLVFRGLLAYYQQFVVI